MVFREIGAGATFEDFTRPIAGANGNRILQDGSKTVTRPGAPASIADIDIIQDLADEGDYETDVIDIGGTSTIGFALVSDDAETFEVEITLYDDNEDPLRTLDDADFSSLSGETVTTTLPVFSDKVSIKVSDTSGQANNTVKGSVNANAGGPSLITANVQAGNVNLVDSGDNTIDPATNTDQPNFLDEDILGYDLVASGDYTLAETNVRGTGDIVIKVASNDSNTFTVTLEWTDGNSNVLFSQTPAEATDVTSANLKFNTSSNHVQLTITDTSGGGQNNIDGTINAH